MISNWMWVNLFYLDELAQPYDHHIIQCQHIMPVLCGWHHQKMELRCSFDYLYMKSWIPATKSCQTDSRSTDVNWWAISSLHVWNDNVSTVVYQLCIGILTFSLAWFYFFDLGTSNQRSAWYVFWISWSKYGILDLADYVYTFSVKIMCLGSMPRRWPFFLHCWNVAW